MFKNRCNQRGIEISHETLCEWKIHFGPLFPDDLCRRDSRWFLDEICTGVDDVRPWVERAVDEHGFVLTSCSSGFGTPTSCGDTGPRSESFRTRSTSTPSR